MTREERQRLFTQMLDSASVLVSNDAVLGMVVVVVPSKGGDTRPIAAIGGYFSMGELNNAFSEVMHQLELVAQAEAFVHDGEPKKVMH